MLAPGVVKKVDQFDSSRWFDFRVIAVNTFGDDVKKVCFKTTRDRSSKLI